MPCILCLPCLWVDLCLRPRRPETRAEKTAQFLKRRRDTAPAPLPSRERTLSWPLPATKFNVLTTAKATHPQLQSILLGQVPLEIRRLIYEEVLGGEVLHILQKPKKLGHYVCRVRPGLCPSRACLGPTDLDGLWVGWRDYYEPTDGGLLPLLRTCRKCK